MAKTINGEAQIHAWVDGKEIIIAESSVRRDLRLADEEGVDCLPNSTIFENVKLMGYEKLSKKLTFYEAVYKELDDRLVRAATTASSLEAEHDSGNTPQSDEDRMKLNELMELCTNLQSRILELEKTKTTQVLEITSLKRRVKKLEKKQSLGEDASKQRRKINDTDADEDITLVNAQDDPELFDVNDLHGEEVFIEKEVVDKEVNDEVQKAVEEVVEDNNTAKLIVDAVQVSATGEVNAASIAITVSAAATITTEEITLAQALVEIKTLKPKAK
nr:hypothetical protein [Tanacetum cinerariifolium]